MKKVMECELKGANVYFRKQAMMNDGVGGLSAPSHVFVIRHNLIHSYTYYVILRLEIIAL